MAPTLRRMTAVLARFAADRSGATAIEYALVAAGVAGAIVVAVYALGEGVQNNLYSKIDGAMK
jgi:pilus assembly protein Flp/PilA